MATRPKTSAGPALGGEHNILPGLRRVLVLTNLSRKAAGALSIVLLAASAAAQHGSPPPQHQAPVVQAPTIVPDAFAALDMVQPSDTGFVQPDTGRIIDSEWCNSWTESGVRSPTVSAKRLGVPGKATSEYQKACGAFKGKKFSDAEQHLRKAIEVYPDYSAAWVVLGQVLESEDKKDEAEAACSKAEGLDPGYVASYLCLSEFAANASDWAKVAKLSAQALALDPIGNPYALYYAADAGLHFNQLTQAEMHAQSAVKLDEWNHLPELHLLLAQIYKAAGNVVGETVQLREFLKLAANSKDAPKARTTLALLEASPAKGQPGKDPMPSEQPAK
jgi:hypothetical protein